MSSKLSASAHARIAIIGLVAMITGGVLEWDVTMAAGFALVAWSIHLERYS